MADQSNPQELNILSMPPKILGDSKSRDELDLQKIPQTSSNSDSNATNDNKDMDNNSKDDIVIMEQERLMADGKNDSSSRRSKEDEYIEKALNVLSNDYNL